MVANWEIAARDLYMGYPKRRRDEAVRTPTFGAAAMIYAARSLGLGSTPMIGFDDGAVHREFGRAEDKVPVVLLSVGKERAGNWGRAVRSSKCWILSSHGSINNLRTIAMPRTTALKQEQVPAGWKQTLDTFTKHRIVATSRSIKPSSDENVLNIADDIGDGAENFYLKNLWQDA